MTTAAQTPKKPGAFELMLQLANIEKTHTGIAESLCEHMMTYSQGFTDGMREALKQKEKETA